MKKGITAVFIAIILMTNLSGCGQKSGHDIYEGIYKRYTNLNSFYAEVEVTVLGDKLKSVYLGRQFYEAPDKFSFEVDSPQEVSGSGYTLKGGKVLLRSGLGDQKVLDVSLNDGMLVCILMKDTANLIDFQLAFKDLLMQNISSPRLECFKFSKMVVETDGHVKWTCDGEYGGEPKKVEIENLHNAIRVISKLKNDK